MKEVQDKMVYSKKLSKIWAYLVGIFIIPFILSIMFGFLQESIGEENISDEFALTVINLLSYLFSFVYYIKLYGNDVLNKREQTKFISIIKNLMIFIICTMVYNEIQSIFDTKTVSDNQETLNEIFGFNIVVGILVTCVMAPVVEEIVYRYILQEWLESKIKNKIVMIIISSAIFALIHMGEIDIWIFGNYFVSALFLTILYFKNKNIYTNILVHSLYNVIQMILGLILIVL